MSRGQRRQSRLSREKDFHARSVDRKHGFKGSEQRGFSRCEKKDGRGVDEHPDKSSLKDASARVRNCLVSQQRFLPAFNDFRVRIHYQRSWCGKDL
jgi:hypothetical protein